MPDLPRVILASTSTSRGELLRRAGVAHNAIAPDFEEIDDHGTAASVALRFAEGKARSISASATTLVIGADQTLEFRGRVLRKPKDRAEIVDQLELLQGEAHVLHAAVAVVRGADIVTSITSIELRMRSLERRAIERYIDLDAPHGAVGGYLFEKRGIWLFDAVTPCDDSAIVGLPLVPLLGMLRRFGVDPLSD